MPDSSAIVSKVWNYAHVLKLADEMAELGFDPTSHSNAGTGDPIPASIT